MGWAFSRAATLSLPQAPPLLLLGPCDAPGTEHNNISPTEFGRPAIYHRHLPLPSITGRKSYFHVARLSSSEKTGSLVGYKKTPTLSRREISASQKQGIPVTDFSALKIQQPRKRILARFSWEKTVDLVSSFAGLSTSGDRKTCRWPVQILCLIECKVWGDISPKVPLSTFHLNAP